MIRLIFSIIWFVFHNDDEKAHHAVFRALRTLGWETTRSRNQRLHAMRRAKDRLGVTLTDQQYLRLCDDIRFGKAELIRQDDLGFDEYRVRIADFTARAIYDSERETISSFLEDYGGGSKIKTNKKISDKLLNLRHQLEEHYDF